MQLISFLNLTSLLGAKELAMIFQALKKWKGISLQLLPKEQLNFISRKLLIITCGNDSSGKAGLAFAQAAHFMASGDEVFIFLVLEGSKWAFENYGIEDASLCFNKPKDHLFSCIELGANVVICRTCYDTFNNKENIGSLCAGINIGGFIDVEEFLKKYSNTLIY